MLKPTIGVFISAYQDKDLLLNGVYIQSRRYKKIK